MHFACRELLGTLGDVAMRSKLLDHAHLPLPDRCNIKISIAAMLIALFGKAAGCRSATMQQSGSQYAQHDSAAEPDITMFKYEDEPSGARFTSTTCSLRESSITSPILIMIIMYMTFFLLGKELVRE